MIRLFLLTSEWYNWCVFVRVLMWVYACNPAKNRTHGTIEPVRLLLSKSDPVNYYVI